MARPDRSPWVAASALVLSMLAPSPSGAQGRHTAVWELGVLAAGKSYPTTVSATNGSCPGRHTFELSVEGAPWFRITGPRVLEGLEVGASRTSEAVVDLREVPPGQYRGRLIVRCMTCPPPPACVQDESLLDLVLRVTPTETAGQPPDQPTAPADPIAAHGETKEQESKVGECGACVVSNDCEAGLTCWDGRCVDTLVKKNLGDSCCVGLQCASSRCSASDGAMGHCECHDDGDCATGEFCDFAEETTCRPERRENLCQQKTAACGCCTHDSACSPGLKCSGDNLCIVPAQKPVGDPCCSRDECKSGICCGDVCVAVGAGEIGQGCCAHHQCKSGRCKGPKIEGSIIGLCECRKDGDCAVDEYCDASFLGLGSNTCRAKREECAKCCRDGQCAGDARCRASRCSTEDSVDFGGSCCRDRQCKTGSCDSSGTCQCTEDGHCGTNAICAKGFLGIGKNRCVALKADCESCRRDRQCSSGAQCKSFKCATPGSRTPDSAEGCCRDYQCTSGKCKKGKCKG